MVYPWSGKYPGRTSDAFPPQKSGGSGGIPPLLFSQIGFHHFFLRSNILGGFGSGFQLSFVASDCFLTLIWDQNYNRKPLRTECKPQKFPLRGSLGFSPASNCLSRAFQVFTQPRCQLRYLGADLFYLHDMSCTPPIAIWSLFRSQKCYYPKVKRQKKTRLR